MREVTNSTALSEWRQGWPVVVSGALGYGCGTSLFNMAASLFIRPMQADLGWSVKALTIMPIVVLLMAFCNPFIGALVDRWGARPIVIAGLCLYAVGTVGLAVAPTTPFFLYALAVFLGVTAPMTSSGPITKGVAGWFPLSPGTAFGLAMSGVSFVALIGIPLISFVIQSFGWRSGYDEWSSKLVLNTGQYGPFATTISFSHRQNDGWVDNLLQSKDSNDPGALNSDTVWVRTRGELGALTADLSFDWSNTHHRSVFNQIAAGSANFINYFADSPGFGGDPLQLSGRRLDTINLRNALGVDNENITRTLGTALTLDFELSDQFSIKSISAYRRYRDLLYAGLASTGATRGVVRAADGTLSVQDFTGGFGGEQRLRHHQYSQELQLLGGGDHWDAVAGLFWFREKGREVFRQEIGSIQPGAGPRGLVGVVLRPTQRYSGTITSQAAFGQVSVRPDDAEKIELTGGLRYTHDKKNVVTIGSRQGSDSWNNVSWLASASYKFSPDVMAYARISTGFRAGGISVRSLNFNPFDPEKVISYEAGLKSELFDRRLRFNLAAFYAKYKDLQVILQTTTTAGSSSDTVNAGKSEYKGIEAELTAIPIEGLTLNGSLGYTAPKYKQFLYRTRAGELLDIKGEAFFAKMAKWNLFGSAAYEFPATSLGILTARVNYSYLSKRHPYPNPRVNIFFRELLSPAQHKVDAYLTLSEIALGQNPKMELSLWVKNLTNEDKRLNAVDLTGLGYGMVSYGLKRTFGLDLTVNY